MTKANIQKKAPRKSGVYELKNFGEHVYTGSASNIQERLMTHHGKRKPNYFRFQPVGFLGSPRKLERQHLTQYKSNNGKLPAWNQRIP
jgi:predicted GIY-YIG superfamily endonuclease